MLRFNLKPMLLVVPFLSATSQWAFAHGDFLYMPQTTIDASVYVSAQNKGPADDELWQIPGILMGGTAYGSEQGLTLNDATIAATYANQAGIFAVFEAGSHAHESELEADIEQALAGYHWTHTSGHIKLEGGQMKAAFSKANQQHPKDRAFTEQALPYQAFLGDHYADLGARAQFMFFHGAEGLSTFGLEVWEGDSFPGSKTADDFPESAAYDVFANYQHTQGAWQSTLGAWYLRAEAEERRDDRTHSGHAHGGAITTTSTTNNTRFTGRTELLGLNAGLLWQANPLLSYGLSTEFIAQSAEGLLRDEVRQASLATEQYGGVLQGEVNYLSHQLAVRYSHIYTDNELTGPAASILGSSAGLTHGTHDPARTSLAYSYGFLEHFKVRTEFVHDESSQTIIDYARIALMWEGNLFAGAN